MDALKAKRGSRPSPRHWMEVSSQRHTPTSLPPGKEPARYSVNRRLGGPHNQSGLLRGEKFRFFERKEHRQLKAYITCTYLTPNVLGQ